MTRGEGLAVCLVAIGCFHRSLKRYWPEFLDEAF
jgi:hypothetical protein